MSDLILLGDIDFLEVNQFTFSPGPHVLRIDFIDTFGNVGVFEYNFTGVVRPSNNNCVSYTQ